MGKGNTQRIRKGRSWLGICWAFLDAPLNDTHRQMIDVSF
jgi:hypothetical protein